MMKHFKNLFKRKVYKEKREVKFDISNCEFLQMSKEEQEGALVSDGHYIRSKRFVYNSDKAPDDFVPEEYKNSSLPLEVDMSFKFEIDFKNLTEVFEPTEKVVIETFEHFEIILKNIIEAYVFSERHKLNKHLGSMEESSRKSVIHKFFIGSFQTFNQDELFFLNNYHFLPLGVEKTNLLSKTYLVERYKKRTLLAEDIDLIKMYLYCPNLLNSRTIHIDFPNLSWLVDFCARRNLMIELNDEYGFEVHHPYSKTPFYVRYKDLFLNERVFDWVIETISGQTGNMNAFYDELTHVVLEKDMLIGKNLKKRFLNFLNETYHLKIDRLRPSNASRTAEAIKRVEELKNSFDSLRFDLE
jgi:hypothetical protein